MGNVLNQVVKLTLPHFISFYGEVKLMSAEMSFRQQLARVVDCWLMLPKLAPTEQLQVNVTYQTGVSRVRLRTKFNQKSMSLGLQT